MDDDPLPPRLNRFAPWRWKLDYQTGLLFLLVLVGGTAYLAFYIYLAPALFRR